MLAVPAGIAGCPVRIMCTPPRPDGRADPAVVAAAWACGIRTIYKAGGAQAIAAMAYGTATIPKVAKIFGPGNAWVTAAKTLVAADPDGAALDMPAGPSEVMVIADAEANPRFVALDLLSQAEHGPDAHAVLFCTDRALVAAVQADRIDVARGKETAQMSRRHLTVLVLCTLLLVAPLGSRNTPGCEAQQGSLSAPVEHRSRSRLALSGSPHESPPPVGRGLRAVLADVRQALPRREARRLRREK